MPLKNIVLIANPRAGRKNPDRLAQAIDLLKKHLPTELVFTERPGHATELARQAGADADVLVAVCGGDGTIFEAMNGLPPQGVLGVLPGGTANVVVRELGISLDLVEAAKVLLTGTIRQLDCGLVGTRKYLMVAGFGFDAHVAASISPWLKKSIGQYAYHVETAWQFFRYTPPNISVMVDGKGPFNGAFALIANMRRYGGNLFFAHSARYNDGELDLVLFRDLRFRSIVGSAARAFKRQGVPEEFAIRLRGRHFVLSSDQAIDYQLDGEIMPKIREIIVNVQPASIRMMAP